MILTLLLCCTLLGAGLVNAAGMDQTEQSQTSEQNQAEASALIWRQWKENAIQTPVSGELVPAGPFQVEWNALSRVPWNVISYRVYLDNVLQEEIEADSQQALLSCDLYATETASHQIKVEAVLGDNQIVTASLRTFFISKKGIGIPREAAVMSQDMGASWYYNWSSEPDLRVKEDLPFVPMIWSDYAEGKSWLEDETNQKYGMVLGYNEPDRTDQSNLLAETAAVNQQLFTDSGLRIGAPAVSTLPVWSDWFPKYAELVNMEDIDFIPVHCYPGWTDGNADAFLAGLDETYEKYQKPIWITEFAIARWDGDFTWFDGTQEEYNQAVQQFMQNAIAGIEERDYIERYAWQQFDLNDWAGGSSSLYNQNTGELTTLGTIYRDLGNPEGYVIPELDGTVNEQTVSDVYVEEAVPEIAEPDSEEEMPVIELSEVMIDAVNNRISFQAERQLPEGYTVIEHGILLAASALSEEDFLIGASGIVKGTAPTTGLKGTYKLTINNIPKGRTLYGRAYLVYQNKEGSRETIYSDIKYGVNE